MHIHVLDDPTRLDLLFKSIAQSIEFIGSFRDKQRQLRKKCQLVSTHLVTPVNLPETGELVLAMRTCSCTQRITRVLSLIYAVNRRGRNCRSSAAVEAQTTDQSRPTSADPR